MVKGYLDLYPIPQNLSAFGFSKYILQPLALKSLYQSEKIFPDLWMG